MSRLVSFGCSYTRGAGLINPEIESWPVVLATLLNRSIDNRAVSGSSNLQILWQIINYNFESDDIVFVMWSHFTRDIIFDSDIYHRQIPWDDKKLTKNWLLTHNDYDINTRNWIHIHHANLVADKLNLKMYNLFGGEYQKERFSNPKCIQINNIIDFDFYSEDLALDNAHPGPKSHRSLAEKIYNVL
jgi:hypothetical protein